MHERLYSAWALLTLLITGCDEPNPPKQPPAWWAVALASLAWCAGCIGFAVWLLDQVVPR